MTNGSDVSSVVVKKEEEETMAGRMSKLGGFEYYTKVLKSPKYCVAPMVNASELPFRMMCRKYGADLAWTPMFHSKMFAENASYRARQFSTCEQDRPLAVQFCGHDPQALLQASLLVQDQCDLVDINFGCPQGIARRGDYGAFLAEDFERVRALVEILHQNLSIPVSCKIRIFPTVERTLEYVRMLEDAGCQFLSVHGRTKENKGKESTPADWGLIKLIKETVSIPVISNGNVLSKEDADKCMEETGVEGVMSAIALLRNPMLFSGQKKPECDVALEYLEFCKKYPVPNGIIAGHMYKMCGNAFRLFPEFRDRLGGLDISGIEQLLHEMRPVVEEELVTHAREKEMEEQKEAIAEAKRAAAAAKAKTEEELEKQDDIVFTNMFS